MKPFISLIFLTFYLASGALCQDETIDLISKVGTDQGEFSSIHFIDDRTFIAVFEKQILTMNLLGNILEKSPNPIELKKLNYNHFLSKNNYAAKEDVFYTPDGYNKILFITDFSSNNRQVIEIQIPEIEGLRSGKDKYNATAKYLETSGSIISQELFFPNKNLAVLAQTYFSMSAKSHGANLPEKEKYHTFMRLIYIDLTSKTLTEEYILKDVLSISRDKSNEIDFKILKLEGDHIQVGVLESKSKLINAAAYGFSYEGSYTIYAYNLKTKDVFTVAEQPFKTEPKAVNSKLSMLEDNFSITWNERIPDGFSIHNKTYHLTDNMVFDSSTYHIPAEIVKLPTPAFSSLYEYENMKKERFCAVGLEIQNKGDKEPVSAYLIIEPTGEYKIIERTENSEIRLVDRKTEREYNLELEGETYEEFCGFFSKILKKNYEGHIPNGSYVKHSGETIRFENGKTLTYSSMVSGNASGMNIKPSSYVATFYFYDYKF